MYAAYTVLTIAFKRDISLLPYMFLAQRIAQVSWQTTFVHLEKVAWILLKKRSFSKLHPMVFHLYPRGRKLRKPNSTKWKASDKSGEI